MHHYAQKSFKQAEQDADSLKHLFMPYKLRMRILDKLLATYRQGYTDGLARARELNRKR